jgi:ferredoxin-thioredoxin reductase catalytic subunit
MTAGNEDEFEAAVDTISRGVRRYAEKAGLGLHPDLAVRRHVLRGLARNLLQYGRPYCP